MYLSADPHKRMVSSFIILVSAKGKIIFLQILMLHAVETITKIEKDQVSRIHFFYSLKESLKYRLGMIAKHCNKTTQGVLDDSKIYEVIYPPDT